MVNIVEINRLKWRSKRSMLEVDLYLDNFIQHGGLEKLNERGLNAYGEIVQFNDSVLLLLLQGKNQLGHQLQQAVIDKIRQAI